MKQIQFLIFFIIHSFVHIHISFFQIIDTLQVAKINFVVMNVLAKGHQKDTKKQPEFDFSKHPHFPIIKLN